MYNLYLFLCAVLGLGIKVLLDTFAADKADAEHDLTPLDVVWAGPKKWKMMANLLFIGAVMFFAGEKLLAVVFAAEFQGVPVGLLGAVIFGWLSEDIMARVLAIAQKRVHGQGKK